MSCREGGDGPLPPFWGRPGKLLTSQGVSLECLGLKPGSCLCLVNIFGKSAPSALPPLPRPCETTEPDPSQGESEPLFSSLDALALGPLVSCFRQESG